MKIPDEFFDYVECCCHSDAHTLKFTSQLWDQPTLYITTFLRFPRFWPRLWNALKYACGILPRSGHFSDTLIDDLDDAIRLRNILDRFILARAKWEDDNMRFLANLQLEKIGLQEVKRVC